MNLLIIGGLLALGLLALVGAVFLAMGERQAKTPSSSATAKTTQSLKQPSSTPAAQLPATEETLPAVRDETPLALNGQYHELANELRTLHEHAIELEQRLSILAGIADHIEHTQANHNNVEEETKSPS